MQWLRRHGSVTGFEARYRNSLGEAGDVEVSARIVERGGEPYLISFLTEVTDRRELIEGLRAAQSRLGIVPRASDMLVFRQDEALRYTWVANPALGATEDELLGHTDEDIMGAAAAAPLLAIEGLDVARALVNVGGQVGVLRRVLDRFVQAYAEGAGPLDRERVHSLRGACAAIGAVDLQAALQAYESAAARAETEELPQRAEAIAQRLRDLVERLRSELAREAA